MDAAEEVDDRPGPTTGEAAADEPVGEQQTEARTGV